MKLPITAASFLLLAASSAIGQMVSSHSPTIAKPVVNPAPNNVTRKSDLVSVPRVYDKTVVKVNGAELTDRDLLREMFDMFPYARLHDGFPKKDEPEIRRGAMQMIIFEELVYQEAERRKMSVAPQLIDRDLQKFKRQFGSQAEYAGYLKAEMGGSEVSLRQHIRRSLLIEALLKHEVDEKSTVTPAEAQLYYSRNPKQFEHGEYFDFQTISFIPPQASNAETVKLVAVHAKATYEKAKIANSYKDFGLLAEKESDDDYHVNMGIRTKVAKESLPPEVVKKLETLKQGGVSDLIQLGNAYTILRLVKHTPAGKDSFPKVKAELMTKLRKQKYEQLRANLNKSLHKAAKIQEM